MVVAVPVVVVVEPVTRIPVALRQINQAAQSTSTKTAMEAQARQMVLTQTLQTVVVVVPRAPEAAGYWSKSMATSHSMRPPESLQMEAQVVQAVQAV